MSSAHTLETIDDPAELNIAAIATRYHTTTNNPIHLIPTTSIILIKLADRQNMYFNYDESYQFNIVN